MGLMKDFLITIHRGGDEAVAAMQRVVDDVGRMIADPVWIPISERQPKEHETVLVCHKGKSYCGELRHPSGEEGWDDSWWMLFKYDHPSREWANMAFVDKDDLWMPMPEPLKK